MKKSEKIEIRLSHEDKTNLTDLAKREGRTISQLVRHLIQNYVGLNTSTRPIKMPLTKIGAFLTTGFIAGALLMLGVTQINKTSQISMEPSHYSIDAYFNESSIRTAFLVQTGLETVLEAPSEKGAVKIVLKQFEDKNNQRHLSIDFYKLSEGEYELVATTPTLLLNPYDLTSLYFIDKFENPVRVKIDPFRKP